MLPVVDVTSFIERVFVFAVKVDDDALVEVPLLVEVKEIVGLDLVDEPVVVHVVVPSFVT